MQVTTNEGKVDGNMPQKASTDGHLIGETIRLNIDRNPSMLAFLVNFTLWKRYKPAESITLPHIKARWPELKIDRNHFENFCRLAETTNDVIGIVYPMSLVYPVYMKMLSDRRFPLSLSHIVNVENELTLFREIDNNGKFTLECELTESNVVAKGLCFTLIAKLRCQGDIVWTSTNRYFHPGDFGNAILGTPKPGTMSLKKTIDLRQFTIPGTTGFSFARLFGDYNPLHFFSAYARLQGYRRAFAQPFLVATRCLSGVLPAPDSYPRILSMAVKGPLYYDQALQVKVDRNDTSRLDVYCQGNHRPGVCIRISLSD